MRGASPAGNLPEEETERQKIRDRFFNSEGNPRAWGMVLFYMHQDEYILFAGASFTQDLLKLLKARDALQEIVDRAPFDKNERQRLRSVLSNSFNTAG